MHKKELNGYVRKIVKMVNDDWHDGWWEYEPETQAWFSRAVASMDSVVTICVGEGGGFDLGTVLVKVP